MRYVSWTLAAALLLCLAGCITLVASPYTPSISNVQRLKDTGTSGVKVGTFDTTPGAGNSNPISLRGNPLESPYQNSYANYLADALKQDLANAGRLAPDSSIEVSGTLLKNDIDVAGTSIGTAQMQARFVVKKGGEVKYDQVKQAQAQFKSSLLAATAVTQAQRHYPITVEKLLSSLFADPAFIAALAN